MIRQRYSDPYLHSVALETGEQFVCKSLLESVQRPC
ncbi:hypothetical protein T01_4277 [Trichinella spiralis]|uniref:Uncharacterized protein n=1 Tax=Trichinella spiralis TaxID=6334 RepID=A0A0V1AIG3_TRISP|nr:hypothetical protein T01_4277 [Trichinella spiralis]